jgi:DNA-binding response OmpR family regulator
MSAFENRSSNSQPGTQPIRLNGPHILIVEDDSDIAVQLQNFLKGSSRLRIEGCDVDIARNLEAAREFLSRDEIDIYIVDLKIPIEEGTGASISVGRNFIKEIDENVCAGIIVFSSERREDESIPSIEAVSGLLATRL